MRMLRCAFPPQIPPSYCSRLVEVMRELQRRRQGSAVFAGKDGFITARDLLRCVLSAQCTHQPFSAWFGYAAQMMITTMTSPIARAAHSSARALPS